MSAITPSSTQLTAPSPNPAPAPAAMSHTHPWYITPAILLPLGTFWLYVLASNYISGYLDYFGASSSWFNLNLITILSLSAEPIFRIMLVSIGYVISVVVVGHFGAFCGMSLALAKNRANPYVAQTIKTHREPPINKIIAGVLAIFAIIWMARFLGFQMHLVHMPKPTPTPAPYPIWVGLFSLALLVIIPFLLALFAGHRTFQSTLAAIAPALDKSHRDTLSEAEKQDIQASLEAAATPPVFPIWKNKLALLIVLFIWIQLTTQSCYKSGFYAAAHTLLPENVLHPIDPNQTTHFPIFTDGNMVLSWQIKDAHIERIVLHKTSESWQVHLKTPMPETP